MILALEDALGARTYLAGDPAVSEAVNGHLVMETSKHDRKQVVHEGVGWENVRVKDIGNGRYELNGWQWRTFATYHEATLFALSGMNLDLYDGTAVFLMPTGTAGVYETAKSENAGVLPMITQVVGVAVKVSWTVIGAYPYGAGTETIAARTTEDGTARTTEDGIARTPEE